MDKAPVIRLNYTKHPQGLARYSMEEWRALNPWNCPYCTTRIKPDRTEYDVVGGKYLAYVVHLCTACGWWNAFKYWEDRLGETIHAVNRNEPRLEEFDLSSKEVQVDTVLQVIRRQYKDLRHVHWSVFQKIVQQMLLEMGFRVIDVSRMHCSGGDLLAIDVDGTKYLVEVKHWNYRPVGINVIRHLKGAIQDSIDEDIGRGLVVVSNSFSRDALDSIGTLRGKASTVDGRISVGGLDFSQIVDWIAARESRTPIEVLEFLRRFHFEDAMSEQ